MTAAREQIVAVDGAALWTCTSGRGVPLVLCHGGPGAYDNLAPLTALVDDIAEVHRFDQRGGGRSTVGGPWSIETLVADVEALRRHWAHERWLVAGHSWGAHLALFYALEHSDRTLGLLMLNGPGVRWGWGGERRAKRLPRLTTTERAEVEALERELAGGAGEPARTRLRDLWWLTDFAERANALNTPRFAGYPTNPDVVAALEQDWERHLHGIDERLGRLTIPSLVLHGEADPIGAAGPRELAELLPGGGFVSLRGVGHLPWLEDSAELRRELRAFVAQFR
ncbi:MAG TPA: alpha/beta fold hydrolase [Thermoleophilaceae bacterium]